MSKQNFSLGRKKKGQSKVNEVEVKDAAMEDTVDKAVVEEKIISEIRPTRTKEVKVLTIQEVKEEEIILDFLEEGMINLKFNDMKRWSRLYCWHIKRKKLET